VCGDKIIQLSLVSCLINKKIFSLSLPDLRVQENESDDEITIGFSAKLNENIMCKGLGLPPYFHYIWDFCHCPTNIFAFHIELEIKYENLC